MITFTVQELLFCAVTKFQTMVNTHSSLLLDQLLPKGTYVVELNITMRRHLLVVHS